MGGTQVGFIIHVGSVPKDSLVAEPAELLQICLEEPDNYIVCAVAVSADFLVTDDKRHLPPIWEY